VCLGLLISLQGSFESFGFKLIDYDVGKNKLYFNGSDKEVSQ